MAYELHGILCGAISLTTWEKVMPAYGGETESFLNNVVTPIYTVIRQVLSNLSSLLFWIVFFNITNFCSNQRKLPIAKEGRLIILYGETMMILMSISGQHYITFLQLFSMLSSFHIITSLLLFNICRSPDCFKIGWPMRLDHDFFFVKPRNKPEPDVKNALVVSPGKTKEKKKREKRDEEEPEVILQFSNALYFRFCISDI